MTTTNQAKTLVLQHFLSLWDAGACPVVYDNETSDGQDAPWARVSIVNTSGGQETLGQPTNRKFERTAHVFVQIFTERGKGTKQADTLAHTARDIFECKTINGIRYGNGDISEQGPDGEWYSVLVDVIFNYDETK